MKTNNIKKAMKLEQSTEETPCTYYSFFVWRTDLNRAKVLADRFNVKHGFERKYPEVSLEV